MGAISAIGSRPGKEGTGTDPVSGSGSLVLAAPVPSVARGKSSEIGCGHWTFEQSPQWLAEGAQNSKSDPRDLGEEALRVCYKAHHPWRPCSWVCSALPICARMRKCPRPCGPSSRPPCHLPGLGLGQGLNNSGPRFSPL